MEYRLVDATPEKDFRDLIWPQPAENAVRRCAVELNDTFPIQPAYPRAAFLLADLRHAPSSITERTQR